MHISWETKPTQVYILRRDNIVHRDYWGFVKNMQSLFSDFSQAWFVLLIWIDSRYFSARYRKISNAITFGYIFWLYLLELAEFLSGAFLPSLLKHLTLVNMLEVALNDHWIVKLTITIEFLFSINRLSFSIVMENMGTWCKTVKGYGDKEEG